MRRKHGSGDKGQRIDPKDLPEDDAGLLPGEPFAAPAPGLPISSDAYERMKEKAKNQIGPSESIAQEDRSAKKCKP
jgi:hypothetical protein